VSDRGATRPLEGDPHPIDGHSRDRFIYAPLGGLFQTSYAIGDLVTAGQVVAQIDKTPLLAPLTGKLRGLTHDSVPVSKGTKVIEVDSRGAGADVPIHISGRPARIAEGILGTVQRWQLLQVAP
jgi:xanthine dehydrogenase accessory factor